jgi:hypothetical protein
LIRLGIRRDLLERAVREDPPAESFEDWLASRIAETDGAGPIRATRPSG